MSEFKSYTHIEPITSEETFGIFNGTVYIEPKIDGSNCCIWWDGQLHLGKRNSELIPDNEETRRAYKAISADNAVIQLAKNNPDWIIYGEFLQLSHIRYYNKEAYYKFYVFDIFSREYNSYIEPTIWHEEARVLGCNVIPILAKFEGFKEHENDHKPETWDEYVRLNRFLLPEGEEYKPEGIVFKNYTFLNKYGRFQVFGKIVTDAYKRGPKIKKIDKAQKEEDGMLGMALDYYPEEITVKVAEDLINTNGGWNKKLIPDLLRRCFHDFVTESLWDILVKEKNPIINFKHLQNADIVIIKNQKPELFK